MAARPSFVGSTSPAYEPQKRAGSISHELIESIGRGRDLGIDR
jgi:hypothetical protein